MPLSLSLHMGYLSHIYLLSQIEEIEETIRSKNKARERGKEKEEGSPGKDKSGGGEGQGDGDEDDGYYDR